MLHMLGHMLFGLIVGIVAKLLMPGQHRGGIIATMILGVIGAWLGGMIGRALHIYPPGHPAGFIMAVIGAIVVLAIYGFLTRPGRAEVLNSVPMEKAGRIAVIIRA
jgi:uncharacterized membrane protein YeaQ/YmgE (transglycosylase-associated protein family)